MAKTRLSLPFSSRRLREERERAGLLQEDLAERTKATGRPVSRSTISHLESDDRRPQPDVLKSLADALDIGIDDLLETAGHIAAGE